MLNFGSLVDCFMASVVRAIILNKQSKNILLLKLSQPSILPVRLN